MQGYITRTLVSIEPGKDNSSTLPVICAYCNEPVEVEYDIREFELYANITHIKDGTPGCDANNLPIWHGPGRNIRKILTQS